MRETEFRHAISGRMDQRSVNSYIAYCRRVERELNVDLDGCDLSDVGLDDVRRKLQQVGVPAKSINNCLSGLRAYATRKEPLSERSSSLAEKVPVGPLATDTPQTRDAVRESSVGELLSLYGEIMSELRERGIVRTGNSPVGDYTEFLFSTAFGWSLARNSASGHDATDAQGIRYQIKGRRLNSPAASRQLSAIRRLDDRTFDFLGGVLFDANFKIIRAALIPHVVVTAMARRAEHTNSWTFLLDDRVWSEVGVRDITAEIVAAASKL